MKLIKELNVAIVGSRGFNHYRLMEKFVFSVIPKEDIGCVVSGGAEGADQLAEIFALKHSIRTRVFLPDWEKYGKKAGSLRNAQIVDFADVVIAFWDFKSPGTKITIDMCKRKGKPCHICRVDLEKSFVSIDGVIKFDSNPLIKDRLAKEIDFSSFYKTSSKNRNIIFSLSSSKFSADTKELFLSLKKDNAIPEQELILYLEYIRASLKFLIKEFKIDSIVVVPSSSTFISRVGEFIVNEFSLNKIEAEISKTKLTDIKFDTKALDSLPDEKRSTIEASLRAGIKSQQKRGIEFFTAKLFFKQFIKFILNPITVKINSSLNKNVIILDDNLSTGTTMSTVVDLIASKNSGKTIGLTLFKFQ